MKKQLILPIVAFAAMALPAHAATLTFSQQKLTVTPGETVTVPVSVDPIGSTVSAVEAKMTYTDSLLTATGFTLAPNWVAMTQSGFDQMGGGTVVKSAGYPGGITATTTYGTLTFTAKAAGTATITVEQTSGIYDQAGANVLSGTQGTATITIAAASPSTSGTGSGSGTTATTTTSTTTSTVSRATHTTKPSTANTQSNITTTHTATTQTAVTTSAPAATATATTTGDSGLLATATPLAAAAGAAPGASIFNSVWSWLVLLLVLLAAGGLWYYYKRRNTTAPSSPLSAGKK